MTKIYYVGYDTAHKGDFVYDIPEGQDFWLLLLIRTPAEFWVDGEMREYPADCAVLYPPRRKILYRACADSYVNDWVRFDPDDAFVTAAPVPFGEPFALPDPGYVHRLFQLLAAENFFGGDYRELSIEYLFKLLFNKLLEATHHPQNQPHRQRLLSLRQAIHNNPGHPWTVSAMADSLHLSSGYLQALYKSSFGVSCMEDVIECRIRLAKEKLIHSPHRIAEIAELCGYASFEHFSRQFRQVTGFTPRDFRQSVSARPAEE